MQKQTLITVGKLKDKNILALEQEYIKRLTSPLQIIEAKTHEENLSLEGQEVISIIEKNFNNTRPVIILLAENGKEMSSVAFAKWYEDLISKPNPLLFIIGGASGHSEEILKMANIRLSLSPMTFPHQFARLILVEQIYRAQTIIKGHPYHK